MRRLAALLVGGVIGCTTALSPIPVAEHGGVVVASNSALSFQRRVDGFYLRLVHRRFNTLETFNDFILRDHFQSPDAFFDYYADLAQSLHEARFDRTRPTDVQVEEFLFENRFIAQVQVRFVGEDRRPLNPGRAVLIRLDRWERIDGRWWIRPGKL